jgi:hypothetical protein
MNWAAKNFRLNLRGAAAGTDVGCAWGRCAAVRGGARHFATARRINAVAAARSLRGGTNPMGVRAPRTEKEALVETLSQSKSGRCADRAARRCAHRNATPKHGA